MEKPLETRTGESVRQREFAVAIDSLSRVSDVGLRQIVDRDEEYWPFNNE